jgi:tripartite-type tricarboxylate transporter receptor subunit TctC
MPTVAASGLEPILDEAGLAMVFPAGMPQAVLTRLDASVQQAMVRPAFQERLASMGFEPIGCDLGAAVAFIANDTVMFAQHQTHR